MACFKRITSEPRHIRFRRIQTNLFALTKKRSFTLNPFSTHLTNFRIRETGANLLQIDVCARRVGVMRKDLKCKSQRLFWMKMCVCYNSFHAAILWTQLMYCPSRNCRCLFVFYFYSALHVYVCISPGVGRYCERTDWIVCTRYLPKSNFKTLCWIWRFPPGFLTWPNAR